MPEQPEPRRQPLTLEVPSPVVEGPPYAELHCRTNFSFLEGASHPDELAIRAAELGLHALAVTDRNSLAGVVRAHTAAKDAGLKLLVGADITPVDAPSVVLLATDRAAYGRLSRLITVGRRRAPKGECELTFDDLADHHEGLLALVNLRERMRATPAGDDAALQRILSAYRELFGDRCYALMERHHEGDDLRRLMRMRELERRTGVPLVAANDVHYHQPQRRFLQDLVTAIRHGCSVAELGQRAFPNGERYLKSPQQMADLFAEMPELIERTIEVADRCRFSLDELRYDYPEELCPEGTTPLEHLTRLTWEGARRRYPEGIPDKVRQLVEHELELIGDLRYEAYFLTVWDLVRFARSRDILCQGRGSAANSAVCYCLGVTSVDPGRIDVLFERFVSRERDEAPDIDVDFEHERREEVLQYIYKKYGRERAGMTAEVITYRTRSAVRDVGKALGLSLDRVDTLAKNCGWMHDEGRIAERFREVGFDPESRLARQLRALVLEIMGFPRHLSQHVGGMVMTQGPLCELVPIENASMEDRTVIEWDKDDLDALGILKVDCLSLGMLSAIRRCLRMIEALEQDPEAGEPPFVPVADLMANIPAEDPQVYAMIQQADTVGVFQIESRAQMSMLPRLKPAVFYDLVIEVAIVRPGPIQGDMVHPFLRRRNGDETVEYPNETVRQVLEKTLGVPIFQEQAMRLAVVAAGFTPGEADQLRRAMGAWRRPGVIDQFRRKLIDGMNRQGYSQQFAEQVFNQIRGFGEYGFPESHAASFALLVYVSCWLKRYHPAAFCAALINSQPMGFYAPAQLVGDAKHHGVEIRPVDVNASDWDCTLERRDASQESATVDDRPNAYGAGGPALRLGFRMIGGLSRVEIERVVAERSARGPFSSFEEFARRTGLSQALLVKLSEADVFGSLEIRRRPAYWDALPSRESAPLFDLPEDSHDPADATTDEPQVQLPEMAPLEEVITDYETTGLSLKQHPMAFLRKFLARRGIARCCDLEVLEKDRRLRVAGLVLLRQRPSTAKGITFMTLEDETGQANLIVRQDVWERFHRVARGATAMIVRGMLQREHGVIHVLVDWMDDLSDELRMKSRSRDFR
ncbi:Error-prone DNA polymerase [Maioricimonas rarisocia]|uniref:Error-prone DNA polymerase n=1 Tax=Maioricimonas rarisocia TaxID=2528026 RepID=A0A517Z553_9PLAN|nr:error-prone DNA polymerase [Maioricimonas rarisocia]QDU37595.1 Error-prone DNA polymerase [Maioricimonas rarisocia]